MARETPKKVDEFGSQINKSYSRSKILLFSLSLLEKVPSNNIVTKYSADKVLIKIAQIWVNLINYSGQIRYFLESQNFQI